MGKFIFKVASLLQGSIKGISVVEGLYSDKRGTPKEVFRDRITRSVEAMVSIEQSLDDLQRYCKSLSLSFHFPLF